MKNSMKILMVFFAMMVSVFCNGGKKMDTLKTVPKVDLQKYLGTWYEIARAPNPFEKNCVGVTATYSLMDNGRIRVINACRKKTLDGKQKIAKGKAWVVDKETNSKLKVQFFWPFSGDYWIMELGKNYEYAVVGEPKYRYLWVLCRTPRMDEVLFNAILERVRAQGYDTSGLIKVPQE